MFPEDESDRPFIFDTRWGEKSTKVDKLVLKKYNYTLENGVFQVMLRVF